MTTIQEKPLIEVIRDEIKSLGYSRKQVSVRNERCGYSTSIKITVHDLTVNYSKIDEIGKNHKSIRHCEVTGDVLEGANTYISVDYNSNVFNAASAKKLDHAKQIIHQNLNLKMGEGATIYINEHLLAAYFPINHQGVAEISLIRKSSGANIKRYTAHNEYAIADALVSIEILIPHLDN